MSPSPLPWQDLLADLPVGRQDDAHALVEVMRAATGADPVVWARRIVGFGEYRYRYESGREGVAPLVGFAPARRHTSIYLAGDFRERYPTLVERLGPVGMGKGCLYVRALSAIDADALTMLIRRTVRVHHGQSVA